MRSYDGNSFEILLSHIMLLDKLRRFPSFSACCYWFSNASAMWNYLSRQILHGTTWQRGKKLWRRFMLGNENTSLQHTFTLLTRPFRKLRLEVRCIHLNVRDFSIFCVRGSVGQVFESLSFVHYLLYFAVKILQYYVNYKTVSPLPVFLCETQLHPLDS